MRFLGKIKKGFNLLKRAIHEPIVLVKNSFYSAKKVWQNESLYNSFKNLLFLNLKHTIPYFSLRIVVREAIKSMSMRLGYTPETAETINFYTEYSLYLLIYLRYRYKLMGLNAVATIGVAHDIADAYASEPQQVTKVCEDCGFNTRVVGEINLLVQYIALMAMASGVNSITYLSLGAFVSNVSDILLKSYIKGFIFYQYPLSAQGICPEHQIAILNNNRLKCLTYGLVTESLRRLSPTNTPETLELQTVFENMQEAFNIVTARENGITIPFALPSKKEFGEKKAPYLDLIDPINISWLTAALVVQGGKKGISFLVKYLDENRGSSKLNIRQDLAQLLEVRGKEAYVKAIKIIVPEELRSARVFFRHSNIAPYSRRLLPEIDSFLQIIINIDSRRDVMAAKRLVNRFGFFDYGVRRVLNSYVREPLNIHPDLFKILYIIAKNESLSTWIKKTQKVIQQLEPPPEAVRLAGYKLMDAHVTKNPDGENGVIYNEIKIEENYISP